LFRNGNFDLGHLNANFIQQQKQQLALFILLCLALAAG
jgi:hypothetical protein